MTLKLKELLVNSLKKAVHGRCINLLILFTKISSIVQQVGKNVSFILH